MLFGHLFELRKLCRVDLVVLPHADWIVRWLGFGPRDRRLLPALGWALHPAACQVFDEQPCCVGVGDDMVKANQQGVVLFVMFE